MNKCLYLAEIYNEEEKFIKIGISINPYKRLFYEFVDRTYCFKIIKIFKNDNINFRRIEQEKIKEFKKYKYTPKIKFDGYTECFLFENRNDILSDIKINKINSSDNIILLEEIINIIEKYYITHTIKYESSEENLVFYKTIKNKLKYHKSKTK